MLTKRNKQNPFQNVSILPMLLLILVLVFFTVFADHFFASNLKHEKKVLQDALERNITQCYALEGCYPYSLSYLEEHYGLTYNKEHFFINYEFIGGNLRPDITIIERD